MVSSSGTTGGPQSRSDARRCGHAALFRHVSAITRSLRTSPPISVFDTIRGTSSTRYMTVPDPLRVDHHRRAMLTLFEAAGMIGANQRAEPGLLQLLLEGLAQGLLPLGVAASALVPGSTHVAADEDVMGEGRHVRFCAVESSRPGTDTNRPARLPFIVETARRSVKTTLDAKLSRPSVTGSPLCGPPRPLKALPRPAGLADELKKWADGLVHSPRARDILLT